MLIFTLKRLASGVILLFAVATATFFLAHAAIPDPTLGLLGSAATPEAQAALAAKIGTDRPVIVQYFDWLGGLLHGDLGTFSARQVPVADEVARALPITLQLTLMGLVIAVVLALVMGILAALYRDRWPDKAIRVVSVASLATPSFWLAVLLIQVVTLGAGWLPASGPLPDPSEDLGGYLARMALPAIALAIPVVGQLTRVVRTSVVEELDKDYVRTAIGAGIPRHVVVGRNVLRNALITPITVLGLRVGYLIGGAVVIEIIFALPGMGTLILNGVTNNEPNLVQGVTLTVALAFVLINIVVDMLYVLVNPRIRTV